MPEPREARRDRRERGRLARWESRALDGLGVQGGRARRAAPPWSAWRAAAPSGEEAGAEAPAVLDQSKAAARAAAVWRLRLWLSGVLPT